MTSTFDRFRIHGGHVFKQIKYPHISSIQKTLRNIHTKSGSNCCIIVRREGFGKIVKDHKTDDDDNDWMQSDDNSSQGIQGQVS